MDMFLFHGQTKNMKWTTIEWTSLEGKYLNNIIAFVLKKYNYFINNTERINNNFTHYEKKILFAKINQFFNCHGVDTNKNTHL